MPINQTMWRISEGIQKLEPTVLDSEEQLEDIIESNIEILNVNWLVIGRQVPTAYSHFIDILAISDTGDLIIIELKKNKTPRDVIAQGLDYASWIQELEADDVTSIFSAYNRKYLKSDISFNEHFENKYGHGLEDDEINNSHQIIIVAAELDSSTERIVNYLNDSEIPVNVIFFKVFEDNGSIYINRAWLIDPNETNEIQRVSKREAAPWNNEFYISFGHSESRNWEDAVEYGFISGGGKPWYSRTLNLLRPGNRIWVNIPHTGYVGVGIVRESARMAKEVILKDGKSIYNLSSKASYHNQFKDDEDNAEYLVLIDWKHTVQASEAIKEIGFFGNQNTVARPRTIKWTHTVDRLKEIWGID